MKSSTKPLPPRRAALVKHLAAEERLQSEITKLQAGLDRLNEQIESAEQMTQRIADDRKRGARSIVDAIRTGTAWSIATAVQFGSRHARARLEASSFDLELAREARAQLATDLAEKQAELDALVASRHVVANTAVLEHAAATVAKQYVDAVANIKRLMTALEGLELATGSSRNERAVTEARAYAVCGHEFPDVPLPVVANSADIAAARKAWDRLRNALLEDPYVDPGVILKFPDLDREAQDLTTHYSERGAAERRRIDLAYSAQGT